MRTLLVAVALVVAFTPSARAASDEAEALIRKGVSLRRSGNDRAALSEFRRAYDLDQSPRPAGQLGLVEQALEIWVEASKHLNESLRGRTDPWVKKNRPALETSLKTVEGHLARIQIGGEPRGAEVLLNGLTVGTLPLHDPALVSPGPVRVEVRMAGYVSSALSIVVAAGDINRTEVRLEHERPATEPERPLIGPRPTTALPGVRPMIPPAGGIEAIHDRNDDEEKPAEPAQTSSGVKTARWITLGFTAVFAAGAAAGYLIREQNVQSFNSNKCTLINGSEAVMTPTGLGNNCRAWKQNASTAKTIGMVGAVGAGVLALTSAVLFFAF